MRGWFEPGFCPMAHVRAVGQVVGAELPNQKLIQKCRLVGGAAAGVKHRLVGRVEPVQFGGDEGKGLVPGQRFIAFRAGAQHHGVGQATGLIHFVIAQLSDLRQAVAGKEGRIDAALGGFRGNRLGAVLAELEGAAVVLGIGPGAARAIKTLPLVEAEHRRRAAHKAGIAVDMLQRTGDRWHAGGGLLGLVELNAGQALGGLGGNGGHGGRSM